MYTIILHKINLLLLGGKYLAVVAVILLIFSGIVGFLFWLDSRVRKLENKSKHVED
jgi:uncharacterized iron-regulated membrane protein